MKIPDEPRVTPHQLAVLLQRWESGSDEAAAKALGITRNTVKNILYTLRWHIGAEDTLQATFMLRDQLLELEARREMEAKMKRVRRLRKAA